MIESVLNESGATPNEERGGEWLIAQRIGFRFVALFALLFMLTLPFPHHFLPDTGELLRPLFEPLASWTGRNVFGYGEGFFSPLLSDTTGLYIHLFDLLVISILFTGIWSLVDRNRKEYRRALYWLVVIASYYLALQLLDYGFNKVFKWQFYLPEPNTLFTTVGETPRDLLYWSTMGASRPYTIFAGIMEVVAALLLLFRRTRTFGAIVACGVMVNVVAINFSFDISVKVHSTFLLFLSLLVLAPEVPRLFNLFFRPSHLAVGRDGSTLRKSSRRSADSITTIAKGMIIPLLLFDTLSPYVLSGNFNDDAAPRPPLHGAYEVVEFTKGGESIPPLTTAEHRWRRLFVHRRGYMIVQGMDDKMKDYALRVDTEGKRFLLSDPRSKENSTLDYVEIDLDNLIVRGRVGSDSIKVRLRKIDLRSLPLLQNEFHWSIDPRSE
ncbi:MAG: hypothetical protein AB7H80_02650 [Candidatus Kapaibacterium sp.]